MSAKTPPLYREAPAVRSMRVRAWVYAVVHESGLTISELEQKFGEDGRNPPMRSCIWNKYQRGEVVPRDGFLENGRPKLVERVEARYPGTANWLRSPIWRLADQAPMRMDEIRDIYEALPSRLRSYFILSESESSPMFWRRPVDHQQLCSILAHFHTFDDLVAGLAMIRETETTQNHEAYRYWTDEMTNIFESADWGAMRGSENKDELQKHFEDMWKAARPLVSY